mmetsp:Transcript_79161/g.189991  ORF Transcript_79161/g.189991 Transcript_79161/m.189991 type:complete len:244 (+) Transcript_79161:1674-2405(+)
MWKPVVLHVEPVCPPVFGHDHVFIEKPPQGARLVIRGQRGRRVGLLLPAPAHTADPPDGLSHGAHVVLVHQEPDDLIARLYRLVAMLDAPLRIHGPEVAHVHERPLVVRCGDLNAHLCFGRCFGRINLWLRRHHLRRSLELFSMAHDQELAGEAGEAVQELAQNRLHHEQINEKQWLEEWIALCSLDLLIEVILLFVLDFPQLLPQQRVLGSLLHVPSPDALARQLEEDEGEEQGCHGTAGQR